MRVAFIVNEFPALSTTFILDQITYLLDRGSDIDVYAQRVDFGGVQHADVARYSLSARVSQLLPPAVPTRVERIRRGLSDVARAFVQDPVTVVRTMNPSQAGWRGFTSQSFYQVAPFIPRKRYDVVHCHFGPNGVLAQQLRQLGVLQAPIITQFHGYDASSYVAANGRDVYAHLFAKGDLFLAVSDRIRRRLVSLGCGPDKIRIHHTGVDLGKIPFVLYPPPADEPRILTVGRLVEKKGFEYGIRATALLKLQGIPVRYTIVGDGPDRAPLQRLCAELNVSDRVAFLGAQSRERVAQLMSGSDILLAPSVTASDSDEEGIPVVIMEALARGLPVVATRHAGIPELITDGVSGLLSPEKDPPSLAEHLQRLLSCREDRERMARAGRLAVESDYDLATLNDRLHRLYQSVAASRSKQVQET